MFGRVKTGGLGQVTTKKMENNEKKMGVTRPRPDGGVIKLFLYENWARTKTGQHTVPVRLQLLKKNPLKLLPVATRQTFPCKYTFLTDSNASLWLFSSVNHETFLEIYLSASNRLLKKILQKIFSESFKHTYNYQEKMAQVFQPRSINRALSRTHPELILGSF